MSCRLYYVNHKEKSAIFYGMYNAEPDLAVHPELTSWLETFGPAKAHYIRSDTPPMYPWSTGNGRVDPTWKLWLMYPGRHELKPSGPWQAWPTNDLALLGGLALNKPKPGKRR